MFRRASYVAGLATMAMIFAIGFSGSGVSVQPEVSPSRLLARLPASAGGSWFWHLESFTPAESERLSALTETDACETERDRLPCGKPAPGELAGILTGIDRWRPLVASHFESGDVNRAMAIMRCESGGNSRAANPVSTARGLFQHLGSAWPQRAAKAGWGGADIYDPEANIAVAAWLVYHGGGWRHWNASAHCW